MLGVKEMGGLVVVRNELCYCLGLFLAVSAFIAGAGNCKLKLIQGFGVMIWESGTKVRV